MRQMRSLHEDIVACYSNMAAVPFFLIIMLMQGESIHHFKTLEAPEWIAISLLAVTFILSQTFRFKGLQNQQASKLQPFMFLMPSVSHAIVSIRGRR